MRAAFTAAGPLLLRLVRNADEGGHALLRDHQAAGCEADPDAPLKLQNTEDRLLLGEREAS